MTWHQRFRGTATLGFLALALALLWRYVRPSVIGIGADEPLIPARFQGKYGFVSERGVVALPFEFDLTSLFDADGCCFVERNDEWFWIDRHGRKRSPASHDAPDDAPWVRTKRGSQWGWVDRQGRETLPFRWDEASEFDDHGWACVKSGDQWGWIDRRGQFVIKPQWDGRSGGAPPGISMPTAGLPCSATVSGAGLTAKAGRFSRWLGISRATSTTATGCECGAGVSGVGSTVKAKRSCRFAGTMPGISKTRVVRLSGRVIKSA